MRLDQREWWESGMCIRLVLLACGTASNTFGHKLCKTGPPELRGDMLASFKVTRVACHLMVMAMGEDGMMEGVL